MARIADISQESKPDDAVHHCTKLGRKQSRRLEKVLASSEKIVDAQFF